MKYSSRHFILLFFLLVGVEGLISQVRYKLSLLEDEISYQVSLISEVGYPAPLNATSSAQVTIKVPAGAFEVADLEDLQNGVQWQYSSISRSPAEAPGYDYLSFSLVSQGTKKLVYEPGRETPLFRFTNKLPCNGSIGLMNHLDDPFLPPNSEKVNVGNQITILGARGNAYQGNDNLLVPCGSYTTSLEKIRAESVDFLLFPNPASEEVFLRFNWNRNASDTRMILRNIEGRIIQNKSFPLVKGENHHKLTISNLTPGNYFIEIMGSDWKLVSNQFLKKGN